MVGSTEEILKMFKTKILEYNLLRANSRGLLNLRFVDFWAPMLVSKGSQVKQGDLATNPWYSWKTSPMTKQLRIVSKWPTRSSGRSKWLRNGIHTALAAWEDIIKMQSDKNKDHPSSRRRRTKQRGCNFQKTRGKRIQDLWSSVWDPWFWNAIVREKTSVINSNKLRWPSEQGQTIMILRWDESNEDQAFCMNPDVKIKKQSKQTFVDCRKQEPDCKKNRGTFCSESGQPERDRSPH